MTPSTAVAVTIPGLAGLEPLLVTAHLIGVILVVGPVLVVDLRLLGWGRGISVKQLHGFAIPFSLGALLLVIPSGLALFAIHASALIAQSAFFYKMLLLFAAAINALIFYTGPFQSVKSWENDPKAPGGARLAAVGSLLIWIAVICCGQSIDRFLR